MPYFAPWWRRLKRNNWASVKFKPSAFSYKEASTPLDDGCTLADVAEDDAFLGQ